MLELYSDEERADIVFDALIEPGVTLNYNELQVLEKLGPLQPVLDEFVLELKKYFLSSIEKAELTKKSDPRYNKLCQIWESGEVSLGGTFFSLLTFLFLKSFEEGELKDYLEKVPKSQINHTVTHYGSWTLAYFLVSGIDFARIPLAQFKGLKEIKAFFHYGAAYDPQIETYFPEFFQTPDMGLRQDITLTHLNKEKIKEFFSPKNNKKRDYAREYLEFVCADLTYYAQAFEKHNYSLFNAFSVKQLRDINKRGSIKPLLQEYLRNHANPGDVITKSRISLFREIGILDF